VDGRIDLASLPVVVDEADVEIRATEAGGLTISRVTLVKGHDARVVFKGLPDDLCQCPHWGYMIKGRLRVWTAAGASEVRAGEAFYWPPGHAPEAVEDSEFLEISPTDQLRALYDHLAALAESG
jgi:hypothetical protein